MSDAPPGSVGGLEDAMVTIDPQARLVTAYLIRITGTYRCPPNTSCRLLIACAQPAPGGTADRDRAGGATVAGGEAWPIDTDGNTHTFAIDLGPRTDAVESPQSCHYKTADKARVAAKLYYDAFAAALDWEHFAEDLVDDADDPVIESDRASRSAPTTPDDALGDADAPPPDEVIDEPNRRHHEILLVSVTETVAVN
ncbi:hypothetical protein [Nocardia thraciensis]